jgi:hypothetical protein
MECRNVHINFCSELFAISTILFSLVGSYAPMCKFRLVRGVNLIEMGNIGFRKSVWSPGSLEPFFRILLKLIF